MKTLENKIIGYTFLLIFKTQLFARFLDILTKMEENEEVFDNLDIKKF